MMVFIASSSLIFNLCFQFITPTGVNGQNPDSSFKFIERGTRLPRPGIKFGAGCNELSADCSRLSVDSLWSRARKTVRKPQGSARFGFSRATNGRSLGKSRWPPCPFAGEPLTDVLVNLVRCSAQVAVDGDGQQLVAGDARRSVQAGVVVAPGVALLFVAQVRHWTGAFPFRAVDMQRHAADAHVDGLVNVDAVFHALGAAEDF